MTNTHTQRPRNIGDNKPRSCLVRPDNYTCTAKEWMDNGHYDDARYDMRIY